MTTPISDTSQPPDRKAVLICFDCGHESSVDGDWILERDGGRERSRCPECGTTITARPASDYGERSRRAAACADD
ncbi:hypothetical protein [Haloterrigena alkaliphila]|uniref:DUF8106 domain-containing protein n=1 Tax=Haloterrigena alkaliphila TaxID=2816475 RepID=A0A8A2VEZ6_9EURY|nr:hypothetical protein [Haloterrigena alkaliphila]QSW98984.1 hypothetical protein J0X25_16615 [Haloterrigena alkaliphila]